MRSQEVIAAFETLAEAPNGVDRLRELVLQLAVRGKLVHQDPNEEPASVLLERIAKKKARLVKMGKIRRQQPLPPLTEDEFPFRVPTGWVWARFADIANIASDLVKPEAHPHVPHVAPDSIEKATGRLLGYRSVAEDGVTGNKHLFLPGQILYSKIRPNLSKVVIVDFGGLCSADMYPIDPWIDRDYLHRYMLSDPFHVQVVSDDNRLAMPKVNQQQLSSVLVAVPPLTEQQRIVVRVNELMSLLDRLEAARNTREGTRTALRDAALAALQDADTPEEVEVAWERIAERMDDLFTDPADVDPLRQTVLQLAVRGRLVPQDRNDEPASDLLERISEEKRRLAMEKIIRKSKELPPLSEKEVPFGVPGLWKWVRLGCLIELVSGQHLKPGEYNTGAKGLPYLTGPADFTPAGPVATRWTDARRAVAIKDDILLTVKGAGVGKTKILNMREAAISRQLMAIRPVLASPRYVGISLSVLTEHLRHAQVGIAIPGIGRIDVEMAPIALPPLAEQHRIVAKVDELMGLLDRLEERLVSMTAAHDAFAAAAVHNLDA